MNRLFAACIVGVVGSLAFGCAPTGVGDPCTPEVEFSANSGSANPTDLSIDVNSVQCDTRVCLQHYFKGRVSCPYGNGGKSLQKGKCAQVGDRRLVFTIDGAAGGEPCCPVIGDVTQTPIQLPVDAQCSGRPANQAVYCSCRCDVPDDPEIDRGSVTLCKCPSGFECTPLCDKSHGNCGVVPKGKWGSYCVKSGRLGAGFNPDKDIETTCGGDLKAP